MTVTSDHLTFRKACGEAVRTFKRLFPNGAEFPADIDKAAAAGLDLGWARANLGLMIPMIAP